MRWLSMLLMVALIASTPLWAADGVLPGSGNEADPYLIEDLTDFDVFVNPANAETYWAGGVYTKLACDPNLAGRSYSTALIAPAGSSYEGIFDGDNHVVRNLTINTEGVSNEYLGLFGRIEGAGAQVKNLDILNVNITGGSGSNYLGGLCAKNSGGTISNCSTTGSVNNHSYLGGLCGYNNGGTITNCRSGSSITGRDKLGGLCGYNYGGTITNCYASGSITGYRTFGGLCGYNSGGATSGTITHCYATVSLTGRNDSGHLGGLCGINGGTISECYATGSITGGKWSRYFGGLCGETENGIVSNCYATGTVTGGEDAHDLGGLCGFNQYSTITNCYATGAAAGDEGAYNYGGFCGVNLGETIYNCFWDTQSSETNDGVGNMDPDPNSVTGMTTALMKRKSNFTDAGWDFDGEPVWRMCTDDFYCPKLAWEFPVADFVCPDGVDLADFDILAKAWLSDHTPSANWNANCDLDDSTAIDTNDLEIFAEHWLDPPLIITDIVWVSIDDDGTGMKDPNGNPIPGHGGFTGQMSKYEITNAQYCHFLNDAIESGDIIIDQNIVRGANGSNGGEDYVGRGYFVTSNDSPSSQITWNGTSFYVRSRDGYDMSNHPVVMINWYGAMAFCNYYGYRLPTEWEWQAVADFDGSYIYGCGMAIDHSKANYDLDNPLGLTSYPYTTPVYYYRSYGYGLSGMSGNVDELTSSILYPSPIYRIIRGGSYGSNEYSCMVSRRSITYHSLMFDWIGFRVCR